MVAHETVSRAKNRNKIVWPYRLCNHRACKFDCTIDTRFLVLIYRLACHIGKPRGTKSSYAAVWRTERLQNPRIKVKLFGRLRGLFWQGSGAYSNYYTYSNPFEISWGSNKVPVVFRVTPIIQAGLLRFLCIFELF